MASLVQNFLSEPRYGSGGRPRASCKKERILLKFKVEKLGKVEKAEVQLAPLTVLVGKNNTGKSYVATSIWALANLRRLLRHEERNVRPKWFSDFLDFSQPEKLRYLEIGAEEGQDLVRYVNLQFKRHGADFLSYMFAYQGFQRTTFEIQQAAFKPFKIRLAIIEENLRETATQDFVNIGFIREEDGDDPFLEYQFSLGMWKASTRFDDTILLEMIYIAILGRPSFARTIYIPAARTGLMLALDALVSDSFGIKENSATPDLPQPLLSFLREMTRPRHRPSSRQFAKLASWLRDNVTHGSIETSARPGATDFKYKPHGADVELPLHATSSMITELAPFLVSLTSELRGAHLIFEEPEAHLHLEAQREMARAIARLVSHGAQVTVTTHSDTFLQQINNLMSLHGHPKQRNLLKHFGYEKADLLDPSDVEAYEFQPLETGTVVHRLEKTSEGFVVQSLNETLMALAKETLMLREGRH